MRFPRPIPRSGLAGLAGLLGTFAALAAEPAPEAIRQLPPAANRKVDFIRDVQPILDASCVKCHGRGKSKGGWRLDTRADVLGTADSGPAVVLGSSERSHLIHLVGS